MSLLSRLVMPIARPDIEHHDREWRKIKRHVIAQCAPGRNGNDSSRSLINQRRTPDVNVVRVLIWRTAAVPAMLENPRHIRHMHDSENKRLLRIEVHRHGSDY